MRWVLAVDFRDVVGVVEVVVVVVVAVVEFVPNFQRGLRNLVVVGDHGQEVAPQNGLAPTVVPVTSTTTPKHQTK